MPGLDVSTEVEGGAQGAATGSAAADGSGLEVNVVQAGPESGAVQAGPNSKNASLSSDALLSQNADQQTSMLPEKQAASEAEVVNNKPKGKQPEEEPDPFFDSARTAELDPIISKKGGDPGRSDHPSELALDEEEVKRFDPAQPRLQTTIDPGDGNPPRRARTIREEKSTWFTCDYPGLPDPAGPTDLTQYEPGSYPEQGIVEENDETVHGAGHYVSAQDSAEDALYERGPVIAKPRTK